LAVRVALEHNRTALHPFVAPRGQNDDDRLQLLPLLGPERTTINSSKSWRKAFSPCL
jgi:hypothetical protein